MLAIGCSTMYSGGRALYHLDTDWTDQATLPAQMNCRVQE